MKNLLLFLLPVISAGLVLVSCTKNSNPDDPVNTNVVAWAVGLQDTDFIGVILYTNDAGETWARQGDSSWLTGIDVNNVWAIDQKNVWIVCSGNRIFRSLDGGTSWIQVLTPPLPGDPNLSGISILDNTTIWVSGEHGTVYQSVDAGNNWTVYDSNFFHRGLMQGIHAISQNIIYVVGEFNTGKGARGFIARTLNGGVTWDSVSLPGNYNSHYWIGVVATDSNNVVIYGQEGHYAVTNNAGHSWLTKDPVTAGDINCLVMLSPASFWGAFDYDQIFKTYDGGKTWVSQVSQGPSNQFLVGIDTYYSQTALIVGEAADTTRSGKILKTTDGGNNWSLRHVCAAKLQKVAFAKRQGN
ncbi:MAG: YCF48-related protein [bacterium]